MYRSNDSTYSGLLIKTNYEKFFKRLEYQTPLPAFWEICMPVNQQ